jgi:imidazolonepropionase-like amidohydrolase
MRSDANRLAGKVISIGAMMVLAWCFSLCSLWAQEQEPETPPPPPLPPPQARTHERVAIRAGRMFDGKSDALTQQQVILVEGTRIVQVGAASEVLIPPGTEVLDLTSATVLPGLIDGHTHIFASGPDLDAQMLKDSLQYRTLEALVNAQRDLYIGFTTLRDLKTLGGMYGDVDLRTAINNGLVQGPRLQVSGRGLATTGGFRPKGYSRDIPLPSMLETVDNPWEARKAVREQLMNGTDWIKIYAAYDFTFAPDGKLVVPPTFTLEEVQAFVEAAHDQGHKVSCHAFGGKGLHNCLAAGVDTIEHGVQLSEDDIQQFKTKGIYVRAKLPARRRRGRQNWFRDWSRTLSPRYPNQGIRVHGQVWDDRGAGYSRCDHRECANDGMGQQYRFDRAREIRRFGGRMRGSAGRHNRT